MEISDLIMESSILTPTQKYATAALFAVALHQSQIHQTRPSNALKSLHEEPIEGVITFGDKISVSDNPNLWIHENSGLLLPVLQLLGVDHQAWDGLKETAGSSSQIRHHVGAFLKLLSEEGDGTSSERTHKEAALKDAVDTTALSLESPRFSSQEAGNRTGQHGTSANAIEERKSISYQRRITALFELLSACIIDNDDEGEKKGFKQKKGYDSRHRVALRLLATWLDIEWTEVEAMEIMAAFSLVHLVSKEHKHITVESTVDKVKSGGAVAAAALTGGTVMALTGALAAPAIAGGLGALAPTLGGIIPTIGAGGFAAAASAAGSFAGSVAVAASFGAAGAGLTGTKMARRVGSLDEFEFNQIGQCRSEGRLAVGIFISGLVFDDESFVAPWESYNSNLERYKVAPSDNYSHLPKAILSEVKRKWYVLRWESNNLIELSNAIKDWLASKIAMQLMTQGAMLTVLGSLLTALTFPAALLAATDVIDSKLAIAIDRSDKAGKLLAEVLLNRLQGDRPVTLVGFSMGARVIFKCLQCLAETDGDNAGIVERVVLLGAPVAIKDEKWEDVRKIVAGRLINVYSTNDWTLGIAFRANLLSQGLAGIQPVDIPGIENVDVTKYIEGHSSYICKTKEILDQLELENYYPEFRNAQAKPHEVKTSGT